MIARVICFFFRHEDRFHRREAVMCGLDNDSPLTILHDRVVHFADGLVCDRCGRVRVLIKSPPAGFNWADS